MKRLNSIVLVLSLIATSIGPLAHASETITYYHLDAQGSPIAATDQQGNVIWTEHYQPYGQRIDQSPQSQTNSRWYTGHPHDEDTGLTYMGARYYDPAIGRFMAIDPQDFSENNLHSFNRYAYANNNPYKYVDPDGQLPVLLIPIVVGVAIEAINLAYEVHDTTVNQCGDCVRSSAVSIPGPVGVRAGMIAGKEVAENIAINPKIYTQLEKQLERDGANSIHKALRSAEKTLQAHKEKLSDLKYKSQVEKTISNVQGQIETLKKFIKDKDI